MKAIQFVIFASFCAKYHNAYLCDAQGELILNGDRLIQIGVKTQRGKCGSLPESVLEGQAVLGQSLVQWPSRATDLKRFDGRAVAPHIKIQPSAAQGTVTSFVVTSSDKAAQSPAQVVEPVTISQPQDLHDLGVAHTPAGKPHLGSMKSVAQRMGYVGPQTRAAVLDFLVSTLPNTVVASTETPVQAVQAGPTASELEAAMKIMRAYQATQG